MAWLRRTSTIQGRPALATSAVALLVAVVGTTSASLIVLSLLRMLPFDWDELSSIGESFGGISALLAAVALAVLAWSMALQAKQAELSRMQSAREMQINLMARVLDDPAFAEPFLGGAADEDGIREFRLGTYMTLHFRYLEFAFVTGGMTETQLRRVVGLEYFSQPAFRTRWQEIRPHWSAVAPRPRGSLRADPRRGVRQFCPTGAGG